MKKPRIRPGLFYYIERIMLNWPGQILRNQTHISIVMKNPGGGKMHPVADRQQKLADARELIRKCIPEGRSLVDELIQERRDEASREL